MNKPADLLKLASDASSIAAKLQRIREKDRPVAFSHVIESAQPFLVASIARHIDKPIWVLCPNVRSQELFFETLINWLPNARYRIKNRLLLFDGGLLFIRTHLYNICTHMALPVECCSRFYLQFACI